MRSSRPVSKIPSFGDTRVPSFVLSPICPSIKSISPPLGPGHASFLDSPLNGARQLAAGRGGGKLPSSWFFSGAPGVSSQEPRGCGVTVATTSQPWPWSGVRGEAGVTAETTEVLNGRVEGVKGGSNAIRSEAHDRLLTGPPPNIT